MPMPGVDPCFYCGALDHWRHNCWTQKPPTSKDHHESRLVLYRNWSTEGLPERIPRITPQQRRDLIENENRMWKAMERKSA